VNLRAMAAELARMFPVRWELARHYHLPEGRLGEPYFIEWDPRPQPVGEGWPSEPESRAGLRTSGVFNPVRTAQFGFYNYARAIEGDAGARRGFLAQVSDLARAQRLDGSFPYARTSDYAASLGWISAMAQGEAASLFLRAYALTNDAAYADAARSALDPLRRDMRDGGASYLRNGDVFFEEVAFEPACHILNGHLYAAFGVWEVLQHGLGDRELEELHRTAIATIERYLPLYDVDGWSCYDLATMSDGRRHWAPLWYHQFHIAQLRVYTVMTQREVFARYAERWNAALSDPRTRKAVWAYSTRSLVLAVLRRAHLAPRHRFNPIALPERSVTDSKRQSAGVS
jgi:hypothetical protein